MFDLSFNCSTRIEQFFISHNAGEILTNHFAYAFLTKTDFNHLMSQPETADRLQQKYAISSNPGQTFYLLIGK
jgi:hypothetical protein